MKPLNIAILTTSLALIGSSVWAGPHPAGYVKAKVVRATPVYDVVRYPVNEQVCWDEQVFQKRRPPVFPTVAGAVVGGVVGNKIGHGSGRAAATVAGVAIGGAVGYQAAKSNYRQGAYLVTRAQCEVKTSWRTEQRIAAWNVDYRYRGVVYQTRVPQKPGKHIRVAVNARPAVYYPGR